MNRSDRAIRSVWQRLFIAILFAFTGAGALVCQAEESCENALVPRMTLVELADRLNQTQQRQVRFFLGGGAEGEVFAVGKRNKKVGDQFFVEKIFSTVLLARENRDGLELLQALSKKKLLPGFKVVQVEDLKLRKMKLPLVEGTDVLTLCESRVPEAEKIVAEYKQRLVFAHKSLQAAGYGVYFCALDDPNDLHELCINVPKKSPVVVMAQNVIYVFATQEFVIIDPF